MIRILLSEIRNRNSLVKYPCIPFFTDYLTNVFLTEPNAEDKCNNKQLKKGVPLDRSTVNSRRSYLITGSHAIETAFSDINYESNGLPHSKIPFGSSKKSVEHEAQNSTFDRIRTIHAIASRPSGTNEHVGSRLRLGVV